MRVILFGATGMVGQGALRECLRAPDVEAVLAVGRSATGVQHAKLRDLVWRQPDDYSGADHELTGWDACFYCLGVTSQGRSEKEYVRITYEFAKSAAEAMARLNPSMTYVHVSAAGADSSGTSRWMWARVKGRAENAILALPFRAAYVFRPGLIQPLHGIRSRTVAYRVIYTVLAPVMPLLRKVFAGHILTTEEIGLAMLTAVRRGASKKVLESKDILALAQQTGS